MTASYRFGRFELRPSTRELVIDEKPAAIGARAFDVLRALVERGDRLVTKEDLLELAWPGLVVEENNLAVQVSALRKLLGQDTIVTVSGYGYRFIPETTKVAGLESAAQHATHGNVPPQIASFIGRDEEVAQLRAMLSSHSLVTLTGVGGIGKTRLALAVAAVADVCADGAWFVDLAPISDDRLVPNSIAATLGVREEPGKSVMETLLRFVQGRALLVVLDNCEHLLAACAQVTRELLSAGKELTIVATSREPLHVMGEALFPVATLPVPDPSNHVALDVLRQYAAVRLFLDRAVACRPDFALVPGNAAAVARICHELDGLPLAIELAAARMRVAAADVIADHLRDRFRLLKSADVTVLPRQQALKATIDWSYELLAPAERALFRQLAVFAGGFALDGVEVISGLSPVDSIDLLGRLVDKSLVVFDAQRKRYRLLETVRQYAAEALAASGEDEATRGRHLAFYRSLAQQARDELSGRDQAAWGARLDAERENIRLAFEHASRTAGGAQIALEIARGFFNWLTWRDVELWSRVVMEAIAHPDAQVPNAARSHALYVASYLSYSCGRYAEAFALSEQSVAIARALGDISALADGLSTLAFTAVTLDRQAEAQEIYAEALALARQLGNARLISGLLCMIGELHSLQRRFDLAEPAYLEALAYSRDDPQTGFFCLGNVARNAIAVGDRVRAAQYLRECLATSDPMLSAQTMDAFLTTCTGLATLGEEWALVLRWQGAAQSHRQRHGLRGEFVEVSFYEGYVARASAAFGAARTEAALIAGRALSMTAAISEALDWLDSLAV